MVRLALSLFCLVVIAGRLAVVFYVGGPIPFHDQWPAEAQWILIPYAHHGLTLGSFLVPNNEHVIALTRALTLLLVKAEGRWDTLTEMVVIAVASPLGTLPLMSWAARNFRRRFATIVITAAALVLGSPLFYGNIVWGFQSQIVLMVALSVAQLHWIIGSRPSASHLALGLICGALAAITFGSGVLATAVSAAVLVFTWRTRPTRYNVVALAGCGAVLLAGVAVSPSHPGLGSISGMNVAHTLMHALSWPDRFYSYWGTVVWAPFLVAAGFAAVNLEFRQRAIFPLAVAGWGFGQAVAIAVGRSEPAIVLAPRYYDIFAIGVLANLLLLGAITRHCANARRRPWVIAALAGWVALVGGKAVSFASSHGRGDLPVIAQLSRAQLAVVRSYYRDGRDLAALERAPFPQRPHPDARYLADLLNRPEIVALWPDYVLAQPETTDLLDLPWLGHGPTRRTWLELALAALAAGIAALAAVVIAAWRRDEPGFPPRPGEAPGAVHSGSTSRLADK